MSTLLVVEIIGVSCLRLVPSQTRFPAYCAEPVNSRGTAGEPAVNPCLALAVKLGQALCLVAQLAAGRLAQPPERLGPHPIAVVFPGPGDSAVDEEGVDGMRGLGVEDARAVLLGQHARARVRGRAWSRPRPAAGAPAPASRGRGAEPAAGRPARVPSSSRKRRGEAARRAGAISSNGRPAQSASRSASPGRSRAGSGARDGRSPPRASPCSGRSSPRRSRRGRRGAAPRFPREAPGPGRARR